MPEQADHLDTILRQMFAAAARSTNYPASLLMLVGHAWLQAWEPLDAADDAIDPPAVSGRDVCIALVRCASTYFGTNEVSAGLHRWGLTDIQSVGRVVEALMEAKLIQRPGDYRSDMFGGSLRLQSLLAP